jgi:hypothetical protein
MRSMRSRSSGVWYPIVWQQGFPSLTVVAYPYATEALYGASITTGVLYSYLLTSAKCVRDRHKSGATYIVEALFSLGDLINRLEQRSN